MLKSHIVGALTKYLNNLSILGESRPFMFDYMQSVIGVSTLIFYYCAGPAICLLLSELTIQDFHYLFIDKIFRKRWLQGMRITHPFNAFRSTRSVNTVDVPRDITKSAEEYYATREKRIQHRYSDMNLNNSNFYTMLIDERVYDFRYNDEIGIALRPLYDRFMTRMYETFEFLSNHSLNDCIVGHNQRFVECVEDLRTIYMFYYKGGNSIRAIIETTNTYLPPTLKIDNLNEIIPFGSDFDTNFLINPYLPNFEKIRATIELFIPIISQFIFIPAAFKHRLENPADDIFTGKTNDQELAMKILADSYSLTGQYLKVKQQDKVARDYRREKKRLFFNQPQQFQLPASTTGMNLNGRPQTVPDTIPVRTKINTGQKIYFMKTLPQLTLDAAERFVQRNTFDSLIYKHFPSSMSDMCFNSLQYSINKSIPKFDLYRYFLNFKLGERITKTNVDSRLIDIEGYFPAEMLDISIVMPTYTTDKDNTTVSCELLELWQNSNDIYKVTVYDKYKIVSLLQTKLPTFGHATAPLFQDLPLFINSVRIQIDDLKQAIKDSIDEKKPEKIPKRLRRIRALQYSKLVTTFYEKDPINDILVFNDVAELDWEIPQSFLDILGEHDQSQIRGPENTLKRKNMRVLFEYYESTFKSKFYAQISPYIQIFGITRSDATWQPLSLEDFFKQFLRIFWSAWKGGGTIFPGFDRRTQVLRNASTYSSVPHLNMIQDFHDIVKHIFSRFIIMQDGDEVNYHVSTEEIANDYTSHFAFWLLYRPIIITVPPNHLDMLLSVILKNPTNDYRVSGFLLYFLFANSIEGRLNRALQGSHQVTKRFLGVPADISRDITPERSELPRTQVDVAFETIPVTRLVGGSRNNSQKTTRRQKQPLKRHTLKKHTSA
jgi:hypothetical protein